TFESGNPLSPPQKKSNQRKSAGSRSPASDPATLDKSTFDIVSEDDIVALGMLVFRQELKPGNQHHVLFDNHHFAKTGLSGVTPNLGQCASLPQGSLQNRPYGVTSKPAMRRFPELRCCTLPFVFRASRICEISRWRAIS